MSGWRPDPSFYPSPRHAMQAPPEQLAYVALSDPARRRPDAVGVVDVRDGSPSRGRLIHQTDLSAPGDALHHLGWNACSSFLCPYVPHGRVERRFLIAPGTASSRIHILDTRPDPAAPVRVRAIEPDTLAAAGYRAPAAVHCGPAGIYVSALRASAGEGPGGIFTLDPATLDVQGAWQRATGPVPPAGEFACHLGYDAMITGEWATPDLLQSGLDPALLGAGSGGHRLHVWHLRKRKHRQTIDLGEQHRIVVGLRPAHHPARSWGFAATVLSVDDLSSAIWMWYREGSNGKSVWNARPILTIPAQPATGDLPAALQPFGAVPPLVTDLSLSLDDRFLYVSCWGTGELRQYDVSTPLKPQLCGTVRIGGILRRTPHPSSPAPRSGGPNRVEISRDGRRIYLTNATLPRWNEQFYPDGVHGWMAKCDVAPNGGIALDPSFLLELESGLLPHQIRLQGGDSSSDSYCFA